MTEEASSAESHILLEVERCFDPSETTASAQEALLEIATELIASIQSLRKLEPLLLCMHHTDKEWESIEPVIQALKKDVPALLERYANARAAAGGFRNSAFGTLIP